MAMKPRVKIDSSILSLLIILTGFLYWNRNLYLITPFFDNFLDFIGFIVVLKGTFMRMWARGHKKAHSQKSNALVTTGPYSLTRNPMYLGSFTTGAGFIILIWPWWSLPLFAWLFYARFKIQVEKEEAFLEKTFGEEYIQYCKKTPRVFPRIKDMLNVKVQNVINFQEVFSTKEKRSLITWSVLAVALETFQETVVFGATDVKRTILIYVFSVIAILIGFFVRFQIDKKKK